MPDRMPITLMREHLDQNHAATPVHQFLPQGILVRCGVCNQLLEIYGSNKLSDDEELEFLNTTAVEVSEWYRQHAF